MLARRLALLVTIVGVGLAPGAGAQGDGGFYAEPVTPPGSIPSAVDVQVSPDGRIFALQKGGELRVVEADGTLLEQAWIGLWPEVFNVAERGLLGFALHPDFPATPDIFFVYTVDDSPQPRSDDLARAYGRVTRYSARADDPNRADLDSRHVVLGRDFHDGIPSCFFHHSIGTIAFGADGSLFVGSGDGSGYPVDIDTGGNYAECFSDTPAEGLRASDDIGSFRSLDLESLGGKILRIDPETGLGYPDNPFYTGDPADNPSRVWALGLRNPFRFSVVAPEDGIGPGTLLIGDVGQANFEELNRSTGGENFGWPCYEGPLPYAPAQSVTGALACSEPRAGELTSPYAYWSHSDPMASSPAGDVANSITGGEVYPGTVYPAAYQGSLFLSDYARQWVRAARLGPEGLEAVTLVGEDLGNLVDLTYEPATGSLLAADIINSQLVRLRYAGGAGSPPVARLVASARTAEAPARLTFDASSSLDPDGGALSYAWTFGDGGEASGPSVEHTYPETGVYPVTVVVTDPDGQTSQASVSVRVGQSAPVVTVLAPTSYVVPPNGLVTLDARATDPFGFDGSLTYEWTVDLVHNDHEHRRFFTTDGPTGTFRLDPHASEGETSHYRATISVTDGEGLVSRVTRTLRENDASEIGVARTDGGEGEVRFARPVAVGRVGLGTVEASASFLVEVQQDGEWRPVRFPSRLPEPDGLQILFVEERAEAVRVAGADSLAVFVQIDAESDGLEGLDGLDVGTPLAPGRAGSSAGGLVVAGGGAVESGAFHLARSVQSGDGTLTARVDGLSGTRATAGAGLALRASSSADAAGVALLASADGVVRLWKQDAAGAVVARELAEWRDALWLRLERQGVRVLASASSDGESWEPLGATYMPLPRDVLSGLAVAAGDTARAGEVALGWFSEVELTTSDETAPSDRFRIGPVVPNPTRGSSILVLASGRVGTYRVEVVDALGRVVRRGAPVARTTADEIALALPTGGLGAGVYIVRVLHLDSGETRTRTVTVVR